MNWTSGMEASRRQLRLTGEHAGAKVGNRWRAHTLFAVSWRATSMVRGWHSPFGPWQSREVDMVRYRLEGQYRTEPTGSGTPMAYLRGGAVPSIYITEAAYRAKGYKPDFDTLPTEDEYDAQ
jgi:hypothetical protein